MMLEARKGISLKRARSHGVLADFLPVVQGLLDDQKLDAGRGSRYAVTTSIHLRRTNTCN